LDKNDFQEQPMTTFHPHSFEIPEETIQVAQASFPKGSKYMTLRDKLGPVFKDDDFEILFSSQGQAGQSPAILALVTVLQHMEGLTDREAADAVRGRIDWKYLLGLPLTDSGFHYSILSPFRDRLLKGGLETQLFEKIILKLKECDLLADKRQQRTDSTHVLAAVRTLNRLECVGETMRRVLDDLARLAPDWLLELIAPDWFERYSVRIENYRLPKEKSKQQVLQQQIGKDGWHLLKIIYHPKAAPWLREIPSVEVLRRVWIQQYYIENEQIQWREDKNLPPHKLLIVSPDDIDARNRTKRDTNWTGYAVHLTETCSQSGPNLITHVETTPATVQDGSILDKLHQSLADKDLLPEEHLADTAYISVNNLLSARHQHGVDLIGPMGGGGSWQAKEGAGFDVNCFAIDWETQTVTCPQGKQSQNWQVRKEKFGHDYVQVRFSPADCKTCSSQLNCTRSIRGTRIVSFKPQAEYEALQAAHERQKTDEFKQTYKKRAGIEGTISQGTRAFNLRRSRYLGLAKTHLQHLATAAAMNLARTIHWLMEGESQRSCSPFAALAPT